MREQLLAHAKKKKEKSKYSLLKFSVEITGSFPHARIKLNFFSFKEHFKLQGHLCCQWVTYSVVIATTTASTVKIRDPWVGLASIKMICSSGTSQRWNINLASVFHLIKTSFWLPWLLDVLASWLSFFLTFMNLFLLSLSFFILETWFQSVAYPSELGHDDVWWQINNLKQQIITANIKC